MFWKVMIFRVFPPIVGFISITVEKVLTLYIRNKFQPSYLIVQTLKWDFDNIASLHLLWYFTILEFFKLLSTLFNNLYSYPKQTVCNQLINFDWNRKKLKKIEKSWKIWKSKKKFRVFCYIIFFFDILIVLHSLEVFLFGCSGRDF